MRRIIAAAALTLVAGSAAALATPCKDPKTGKFAKCGTPGAKPVSRSSPI